MRFETCFKRDKRNRLDLGRLGILVLSVAFLVASVSPAFAEFKSESPVQWSSHLASAQTSSASAQKASNSSYRAGIDAYHQGAFSKALVLLKQAYGMEPNNANVRYYMAVVLDKMDRSSEALPHYQYVMHHGSDSRVMAYAKKRVSLLKVDDAQSLATLDTQKRFQSEGISVPLKPHKNALMVEASLNDRAVGTFIVDTGATYTSISRELYESLGPETITQIGTVRITTANGRIEVPKILIDRISINGLEARNVEATVINVRKNSSFSGLLGLSFIRQFKLTIDPTEGRLVFQAI